VSGNGGKLRGRNRGRVSGMCGGSDVDVSLNVYDLHNGQNHDFVAFCDSQTRNSAGVIQEAIRHFAEQKAQQQSYQNC